MNHHILLVDDERDLLETTRQFLEKRGYRVDVASSGSEGVRKIKSSPEKYSLVLLDYGMPGMNGAETARLILNLNKSLQILIYSGDPSRDAVLSAFRAGAVEFIRKDSAEELLEAVNSCCKKYDETLRVLTVGTDSTDNERLIASVGMVGRSESLASIARQVLNYRTLNVPVLIFGETGTGKELIAKALHSADPSLFHAVNCGKFIDGSALLESELFGYERGAFTGANERKAGLFEVASGGTVFLDEVHHLNLSAQTKLLRVLQERKIRRLGANHETAVKFRLITAAKPEIEEAVRAGRFLPDLYQRLLVLRIDVPALRERLDDIPPLVALFSEKFSKEYNTNQRFLAKTVDYLRNHDWSDGNIRELEHTVQRIMANHMTVERIEPHHLERKFFKTPKKAFASYDAIKKDVENYERALFKDLVASTPIKSDLARSLGISLTTLASRLKKLGLERGELPVENVGLPMTYRLGSGAEELGVKGGPL